MDLITDSKIIHIARKGDTAITEKCANITGTASLYLRNEDAYPFLSPFMAIVRPSPLEYFCTKKSEHNYENDRIVFYCGRSNSFGLL